MARRKEAPTQVHKSGPPLAGLAPKIGPRRVADLRPDPRNARKHDPKQVARIAESISRFGFNNPILVDGTGTVIAGHGRLAAAKQLGLAAVPTLCLDHLSEAERRAYRIADNRLAELSSWDKGLLAIELGELQDLDFELELTGFDLGEIGLILDAADGSAPEDAVPPSAPGPAVSRPGDVWILGEHRLFCGSALEATSYERLMVGERAAMVFTDPPYNVPISGHVSGLGRNKHREFAAASGEMSEAAFTAFLRSAFELMAGNAADGAVHFVCMDWRHMGEVLAAAKGVYSELKNLCVWNKDNGGMGSLYRSKHELVFVYKSGSAPHTNNVALGKNGRNRTNVWDFPGQNTFHAGRAADLAAHPTVKPTNLVAEAIRDVSRRGEIVLDPFGGSGTTILAAEKAGRRARLIELDPAYVDVAVRRWETLTGCQAVLDGTGSTFAQTTAVRRAAEGESYHEAA
ncbi:site-specific DNA-methyltransferase [Lichenibacterium dinghuense]|uniref:site-specific DNA-methyltransferase n=1 Tax=Lichenibacterium dinghuense TaxID=2895977 RepID=UPI001F1F4775|nr:DNA methyltransferase [Lichenibacterium sp. 6Y81]